MGKQACYKKIECLSIPSESSLVLSRSCTIDHISSCQVYANSEEKQLRHDDDL